jgi:fructan beta-fructosidase
MLLRVGGGFDLEALTVSLWIDGKREFSETGMNTEDLSRRAWLVGMFRGKQARLEIVDASGGRRGHIMVDEVIQWRAFR